MESKAIGVMVFGMMRVGMAEVVSWVACTIIVFLWGRKMRAVVILGVWIKPPVLIVSRVCIATIEMPATMASLIHLISYIRVIQENFWGRITVPSLPKKAVVMSILENQPTS